ncbi:lysylphosphatidylglycerol synthase domain-containing protein [Thermodesulfobacteriota bacterium]
MKAATTGIKIVITALLLGYVFYAYVDLELCLALARDVRLDLLVCLLALNLLLRFLLAGQIRLCFLPSGIRAGTMAIFKAQQIAALYAYILPSELAAGGISWYLLSQASGKRAMVAVSLIYVRVVNLGAFIPLAVFALLYAPGQSVSGLSLYVGIFAGLLFCLFVPFVWKRPAVWGEALGAFLLRSVPVHKFSQRLLSANRSFWQAVTIPRQMPAGYVLGTWAAAFVIQGTGLLSLYVAMRCVNIHLPLSAVVWVGIVLVVVHTLPVTIGGTGLRELGLIYLLQTFYGVRPEAAVMLSVMLVLVGVFWGGLLGGYASATLKRNPQKQVQ